MDRQKLIELALETGLLQKVDGSYQISKYAYLSDIELFARAVAKQERKACVAEILEQIINEQIRVVETIEQIVDEQIGET